MAITFYTPQQLAQNYLTHLGAIRPDVNVAQTDSDWYIRAQVVGGLFSGVQADQRLLSNDAFPQSARPDAISRFLQMYYGNTTQGNFLPSTASSGNIVLSGASGTVITPGLQLTHVPTGNTYQITGSGTLVGATGTGSTGSIAAVSIGTGQSQNLLAGAPLTVNSPPAGVNGSAYVDVTNMADGTDQETVQAAAARILNTIQTPISGGTANDYKTWALAANPSVTSASVIRFAFGYGTVAIVITAGTTNIDAALNAGQAIVQIPSAGLITAVQAYIDSLRPLTDCAYVLAPTTVPVNVTVSVRYVNGVPGDGTIPPGQTLTQDQLVIREVQRAIYKTPPGGRQLGSSGFVVASEMEENIDLGLSAGSYITGIYAQIILDREVSQLSATGYNLSILGTQIPVPGTITVQAIT